MLILNRNEGESLTIGDNVKVTILEVTDRAVKLGVNAPKDVSVHREEIYLKIQSKKNDS